MGLNALSAKSIERLSPERKVEKFTFTNVQVESARLKAQGYSLSQIAKKLGKNPQDVSRGLKSFEAVYREMYRAVRELSGVSYLKKKMDYRKLVERSVGNRELRAKEGVWPGVVPFGYKVVNGAMVVDPEKASVVRQVFEGCSQGVSMETVRKRTGLRNDQVYRILRNPLYKGEIRWRGQIYRGRHEPIVSRELWDSVQNPHEVGQTGVAPFGFHWVAGRLFAEDEKLEKVKLVFKLACERKGIAEIARITGISRFNVANILKRPFYRERGVVSAEVWQRAQSRPRKGEVTRERARQYGIQVRLRILKVLPAKTVEVAKALGIDRTVAHRWLRRLESEGVVVSSDNRRMWQVKQEYVAHPR